MFDEIIIGEGNFGSSSIKVFNIDCDDISENGVSYWINDRELDISLKIMKNTSEGYNITSMITKKATRDDFSNYIRKIVLRNIDVETFNIKITNILNREFVKGEESKMKEIQKVLGIKRY